MNKRGQVFLIAAFIFAIAIYSVVIEYNTIKTYPGLEDYKDLSDNYQTEYPKVINFAIYNETNPTEAADKFTDIFLDRAHSIDPNFGVFYMFKDAEGNLHIVNTLNEKALKLEFTDVGGEEVELTLLSEDHPVEGELCINGICDSATSFVGNFDSAYFRADEPAPDRLAVSLVGVIGARLPPLNITEFTSMSYLESEEPIPIEPRIDQVRVTLVQY